jgi:hypothetical protein
VIYVKRLDGGMAQVRFRDFVSELAADAAMQR